MWTAVLGTTRLKNAHSDLPLIDSITGATKENFQIFKDSSNRPPSNNPRKKSIENQVFGQEVRTIGSVIFLSKRD